MQTNGALRACQDEMKDETPASDAAAGGGEDAAVVVVLLLLLIGAVIGYAVFYKKRVSPTHLDLMCTPYVLYGLNI